MSQGFDTLGLGEALVAAAAARFDAPTSIQRAAIPLLRRGGNAVITAGSGSGLTAALVLALLDRLVTTQPSRDAPGAESAGTTASPRPEQAGEQASPQEVDPAARPRALVLTATEERAASIARTAALLNGDGATGVRAWTAAWNTKVAPDLLVSPVTTAARAIRESALKLDDLLTLVIDGLDTSFDLHGESAFDAIAVSIPRDAQRVVTCAARSGAIDRFVEAHVRRAVPIPARPADPDAQRPVATIGALSYIVVAAGAKPSALARLLRRPRSAPPRITVRSTVRAAWLSEELRLRGWRVDGPEADLVIVPAHAADRATIACDVPFDADALAKLDLNHGIVVVEAHELPHLRRIAAQAGVTLEAVGGARPARDAIAAFRARVRRAISEQDLGAQLALLGPLLDEYAAEEVAAALSALLRKRIDEPSTVSAGEQAAVTPAGATPFVRLYMSIGHREGIGPGDIVGAITGETAIGGDRIGKIDIRENFSVVEVAAADATKVIQALNGTTVKGRSLRVDFDRRPAAPGSPRPATRQPASRRERKER